MPSHASGRRRGGDEAPPRCLRSARARRGGPPTAALGQAHEAPARRDLALLHLLGSSGLRRAETAAVLVGDVDERRRSSDPPLRQAIKGSTCWWVTVRYGKRGRTRAIPLDEDTLAAITAWVKVRPAAATELLLLSLPRTGQPPRPLGTRDIARIVERYAAPAGCPRTGALRTSSGTPSAPTWPTAAPTPR
jgi:site-specific recombinase XerD